MIEITLPSSGRCIIFFVSSRFYNDLRHAAEHDVNGSPNAVESDTPAVQAVLDSKHPEQMGRVLAGLAARGFHSLPLPLHVTGRASFELHA